MTEGIEFYIDDKSHTAYKAVQSVSDILVCAGKPVDQFILISSAGVKYFDSKEEVKIHSGDRFTTQKRDRDSKPDIPTEIHYRVNGEKQTTVDASLSVEQILRRAGKAASIDLQQIDSYFLENVRTGSKHENLSDIVVITNDEEFLAVHSGKTPVAFFCPYGTD